MAAPPRRQSQLSFASNDVPSSKVGKVNVGEFRDNEQQSPRALSQAPARVDSLFRVPLAALDDVDTHVRRLTMVPRASGFGDAPEPVAAYELDEVTLSVPRWYACEHLTAEVLTSAVDATSPGEAVPDLEFLGTLTDVQERALTSLEPTPESPVAWATGGVLVLPCGFGKTVAALAYACRTGVRTLVVVAKSFLMEQWAASVHKFTNATVGTMQRDKVEVGDITIAMAQSLYAREGNAAYDAALARFGLVVVDEAHHFAARAFWRALSRVPARRVLALSATPHRSDGLTPLLLWTVGPIAFRTSRGGAERVTVCQRLFHGAPVRERTLADGKANLPAMVTALAKHTSRTAQIAALVRQRLDEGHAVLVLSERLAHLTAIEAALKIAGADADPTVGWYVGATRPDERARVARECACILSTYTMSKEGLDIPRLSCVVLATPKGDVEQSVGRCQRPCKGKLEPVVDDVLDHSPGIFAALRHRRAAFYRREGYECCELAM